MTKANAYQRKIAAERNAWASEFDVCWLCGRGASWLPLQTHEILSRANAPNCWGFTANYFRACNDCHASAIPAATKELQLAHKLVHDPARFSLVEMRQIRSRLSGRDVRWVDEAEILEAIRQMILRGELCPRC